MVKGMWRLVMFVGVVCVAGAVMASDVPGAADRVVGPPDVAEGESGPPAALPPSTAERLRALTPTERLNAGLSLEGVDCVGEVERQQALQVEALWTAGRHDEAIAVLSQLEANGAKLAAGIAWRQPVVSQPKSLFTDARIGATRDGAQDVALDFDRGTGNLFAVVGWPEGWTVNISTDDGVTWAETYFWSANAPVDATVVDQYLYVVYGFNSEARIRRFFVADGEPDTSYDYYVVANVSPDTILDIVAGANADASNDRVYCAFIQSNNAVRFFWDVASDGTTWISISPPVANAESGLDYHWGGGTMGTDPVGLWISYLATDDTINVLGRTYGENWLLDEFSPGIYSGTSTRISAHRNNVFVAFTGIGANASAPEYLVSYDNGQTWNSGMGYDPPAGEPGCHGIDITARGGWGSAMVWNVEDAFDTVSLATREDYHMGGWNDPVSFNQFDAVSGAQSFIQYLGTLEAVGMVYLAGNSGDSAIPYFDRVGLLPFGDGFESHDTSGWSATVD